MTTLPDIAARVAAATKGEWSYRPSDQGGGILLRGPHELREGRHPQTHLQVVPLEDCTLIAHSRDDLAWLLAEHARLTAALERIIGMCDVPPACACGRPNGIPAVVACARAALTTTATDAANGRGA